ncbi:MAG: VWA domain-containing protein [Candidatus Woesearchaeota archaeon]
MEISFLYPRYLWFLASIPFLIVLHLVAIRFTKRKAMLFANFEAIKRVGGGFMSGSLMTKNITFLVLRSMTLLFLVGSLSGTMLYYEGRGSAYDFVLAIDASGSMLADDFKPTRLEVAKETALTFVDTVPSGSNVAVVSFSGTTFVKQRMTDDLGLVKSAIQGLSIEFASGTAIGDAVITASNLFEREDRTRAIVLLTDGQSNVGVLPEESVPYASKNHIAIFTVGVATQEGGRFQDIAIVSRLDEQTLSSMAESTGGKFFRVGSVQELQGAFLEIALSTEKKVPVRLAVPFLILAMLLLFSEWLMINTKYRTIP